MKHQLDFEKPILELQQKLEELIKHREDHSLGASRFNFAGPGGPPAGNLAENFSKLLRDLMAAAPHAKLNRGAAALSGETPQPFSYPSKNAYHEEIIWSLWRLR